MNDNGNTLPPQSPDSVRISPIGGLGEVGMNCMVLECGGEIAIIDCGVTFPEAEGLGVDLIIPDMTYLRQRAADIKTIILTHAHEDHIGALPWLLPHCDAPIYGTPLTLGMLRAKLREYPDVKADTRVLEPGQTVRRGVMSFEFIHVNHSIPGAVAVAIDTPAGLLIHTGDFRIDHTPIVDPPIDLARFGELGDQGVLALLSDSTNVSTPGSSRSEREVLKGLADAVRQAPGRVVITMFSSNLHRLQGILDLAHKLGRRVAVEGRSLQRNLEVAREHGVVKLPSDKVLVDVSKLDSLPASQAMLLCTGSQGEMRSALARMSRREHRNVTLGPGDVVVFSARVIPGNERSVGRVIDQLYRQGVSVVTVADRPVHTTGHAYREEQMLMINLTRPQVFVPVHGEYHMLIKHAAMAERLGVGERHVIEDGDVLDLDANGGRKVGQIQAGKYYLLSRQSAPFGESVMNARRRLARGGVIVAWLDLDVTAGELLGPPDLLVEGILPEETADKVIAAAQRSVVDSLGRLADHLMHDDERVAEEARVALRRFFRRKLDIRPPIFVRVGIFEED